MPNHAKGLGKKLGPLLFQLPPRWKKNTARLENFFNILHARHRYVFEFGDEAWYEREIFGLLRKNKAAFCIYELAGHRSPEVVTADFVYVRLYGPGRKYQGNYSKADLNSWKIRCTKWTKDGLDVYIYFDNDEMGYAANNALL